jgi:hypothetical protein
MAQNITLLGASYSNVPSVQLPKTGGGTATFDDTTISSNAAAASDIASGKLAYVNGSLITGTNSGGGGSSWTLLTSTTLTVKTTSTTAASAGTVSAGSAAFTKDKIIYVRIRDKAGPRTGYFYGSDAFFINYYSAINNKSTYNYAARSGLCVNSSGKWTSASASYGVYGYSIATDGTVTIRRRYNSSYGTIDGTFLVQVYAIDYPDGKSPFDTGVIS